MINVHETAARNKNAAALVAVLRRIGITSRIAETADDSEWAVVAREAGVLPPSAETIALVLQLLGVRGDYLAGGEVIMTKRFSTLGVLGVASGFCLRSHGFGDIHEVLDHFYPGITTIGCAVMGDTAKREVLRQVPSINDLGACDSNNWEEYARAGLDKFGETIELSGPHGTGNPDMEGK